MHKSKNFIRLITFCRSIKEQTDFFIETVKIPMEKDPPPHRLICLYGNPLSALKRIRQEALKEGKQLHRVDLDVERGENITGNTTIESIGKTFIVALDRLDKKLNTILTDLLLDPEDVFEFENANHIIGQCPDRLNRIWSDPRFAHLSVIVWSAPVSLKPKAYEKYAALKALDLIVKKDIRGFTGDPDKVRFMI